MKVDHVTYQVPYGTLHTTVQFTDFFDLLEMKEVEPDGEIEKGWTVRWWEDATGFQVHLVEPENNLTHPQYAELALGHFCTVISREGFKKVLGAESLEHYSGGMRAWLKGPAGLRVEVRPKSLCLPHPDLGDSLAEAERQSGGTVTEEDALRMGRRYLREYNLMSSARTPSQEQERILVKALAIYDERNGKYNDNWRRFGWRGCLFRLRERVERAWDHLWDYDLAATPDPPDLDDLYDLINFAAFTIRAIEENNRDGSWW